MSEKFNINITSKAQNDLEEIWRYIAEDNLLQAEKFVTLLEEKINSLEVFPERCPQINHPLLNRNYRQLIYENYRTVFRIEKNQVYILRIIHTARLLESMTTILI